MIEIRISKQGAKWYITKVYAGIANTALVCEGFATYSEANAYAKSHWPTVPRIRG